MAQGNIKILLKDGHGVLINGYVYVKKGGTVKSHKTAGGTYTFYNLQTGTWIVSAKSHTGWATAGPKYVNVGSSETAIVTLVLRPKVSAKTRRAAFGVLGMEEGFTVKKALIVGGLALLGYVWWKRRKKRRRK